MPADFTVRQHILNFMRPLQLSYTFEIARGIGEPEIQGHVEEGRVEEALRELAWEGKVDRVEDGLWFRNTDG